MFRYHKAVAIVLECSFLYLSAIVRVYYLYYNILFLVLVKLLKMDDSLWTLNVKCATSMPTLIISVYRATQRETSKRYAGPSPIDLK